MDMQILVASARILLAADIKDNAVIDSCIIK